MTSLKSWIQAARPRTLPLAISGILMGAALSFAAGGFNQKVTMLAVMTAVLIQIFSNFANDLGDSQKGTDNPYRVGPKRTVQSGEITPETMKSGMIVVIALCLVSGIWLVIEGTRGLGTAVLLLFLAFGSAALAAAYYYTAGRNPYGYAGLGDLAVWVFFGILAVAGTYFLNTHTISCHVFLPAASIGFFSAGVLNLNNMRDIENDRHSGKKTIAVRIGSSASKNYHAVLVISGLATFMIYNSSIMAGAASGGSVFRWLFVLSFPLFIKDLVEIRQITAPNAFDPFLKKLALATLLFTLLFWLGLIVGD